MDCPNCGLLNPSIAERCDCGFDFKAQTLKSSYLSEAEQKLGRPNKRKRTAVAFKDGIIENVTQVIGESVAEAIIKAIVG